MSIFCNPGLKIPVSRSVTPYSMSSPSSCLLYRGVDASPLSEKYEVAVVPVRLAIHCPVPCGSVHAPAQATEGVHSRANMNPTPSFNTFSPSMLVATRHLPHITVRLRNDFSGRRPALFVGQKIF